MSAFDPSAPGLPLVGGGGAALPDTPANVLLDAGNADTLVALAAGTGAGVARSYIDAFQTGAVAAIGAEVAGTALIADGLGDVDTTSADVSAFLAAANAAAALASIGGASDPIAELPESASVTIYLRNADLRGQDGAFAAMWAAAAGPPGFGLLSRVTGTTDALWYGGPTAGFPVFQTTSSVRELRWQGALPGGTPLTPGTGSASWSVMVVVVGAQLTGTAAAILGWGNFPNGQNVCLFSRWNSKTAWGATVRSNSSTDETQIILDDSGFPATTDPTALLLTYDGTALSLWKAVSGDASWVSVGTLTVTLNLATNYPLCFSRAGGNSTFASTVGIREVAAWRAALDSDARTALRTYITTAGLL